MAQQQHPPNNDDQSQGAPSSNKNTAAQHPQSRPSFLPWLTPGSALLGCALPLGIGTYLGYRQSLHEHASPSKSSSSKSKSSWHGGMFGGKGNSVMSQMMHAEPPIVGSRSNPQKNATNAILPPSASTRAVVSSIPPPVLAARALVIGSLLSVSSTALLLSGIFFASGCNSTEELMTAWKIWAPRKLHEFEQSLENALGIPAGRDRRMAKEEYERDVEGMTEEEELEYVQEKYGAEIQWEAGGGGGDDYGGGDDDDDGGGANKK